MSILKRWSIYIVIFITAVLLTDQYREFRQWQEFEAVRKDLILQEKAAEKNCIKNALYYEARSEGKEGILAVASVIENRVNHPAYPSTYCGVIQQHKQFSYTLEGKPDVEAVAWRLKAADKQAYGYVSEVSDKMLNGGFKPVLDTDVLHYAKYSVRNYWTKTKAVATRIGKHIFYKEKSNDKR
jgi:spore germination cell wall hydrolase CwlJ-like protein